MCIHIYVYMCIYSTLSFVDSKVNSEEHALLFHSMSIHLPSDAEQQFQRESATKPKRA